MNCIFKCILVAFSLLCTIVAVDAQQLESSAEQAARLAKIADENQQNWQMQYDAGLCYLDSTTGPLYLANAEKYLTRALELAQGQTEKRDTILSKSLDAMGNLSLQKNDIPQMIDYYTKSLTAYIEELGAQDAGVAPRTALLGSYTLLSSIQGTIKFSKYDAFKLFQLALGLYSQMPIEQQHDCGKEDVESVFAFADEMLILERIQDAKDKVWIWTDKENGKTYTILAFDDLTFEHSVGLIASMFSSEKQESDRKRGLVLIDEDGYVSERIHGDFDFSFGFKVEGNCFKSNGPLSLVKVSSERRKELLDALNTFDQNKNNQRNKLSQEL